MDSTSTIVMQLYADMPKDDDDSSGSSSESEYETDDEKKVVTEEEVKINPLSLETQYINAMVAKINAENEKNHPERSSKSVWEMLYGNMKNFEATSSEEEDRGEGSPAEDDDDEDDDISSDDESEEVDKKLSWEEIEGGRAGGEEEEEEEEDSLLHLRKSMPEFIMDTKDTKAEEKPKKKFKEKKEGEKKGDSDEVKNNDMIRVNKGARQESLKEVDEGEEEEEKEEEEEEEEVEVEETAEEKEARYALENKERIAKELACAAHEWLALHTWLMEFRLKHNMTVLDFLEYAEAEPDMTQSWQVKQLLNRTGHKFNPSESHATWGGRTRKLLKRTKAESEGGQISHKKYIQLRLLHYRSKEFSPDDELQYTLRLGYVVPPEEEECTVTSAMFDDMESIMPEGDEDAEGKEAWQEQKERARMSREDDNKLAAKYNVVHQDMVRTRSAFRYESGSDISDSDESLGDTDSSSEDEFFWVGGAEGHSMRKEQRKMLKQDFNLCLDMFDTAKEREFKRELREKLEKEAREEAERCPADVAGKIAWRLKQFEKAKAKQEAEEEARRIAQSLKAQADKERQRAIRRANKAKKARAMALLKALSPDTLFI